ncbi:uncharacterized protein LOC141590470 [Silene latifolia]|uniref:uncharacterized protein LOC141590470 n=1 Tax=Silene latifolia TaxID=37657 RepID=UPI003D785E34
MKAIAWNCRGLNNPLAPTIIKLRAMLYNNNSYDLVFISETKCKTEVVSSVFRHYGFINSVGVDALGSKGGLWVGWRPSFDIVCIIKCMNYVILKINECSAKFWYFCCVYGEPKKAKRMNVWLELEERISKLDSHFIMLGDFNQVEFQDDKYGGTSGTPFGAQAFSEWMVRNSLMEITYKGPKYTWCNNRKGNARVYERLDKGVASSTWLNYFPSTGIKHLPIQGSDHAPIIMDTNFFGKNKSGPLKMEAWAFDYEECLKIVKDSWGIMDRGSASFKLMKKLKRVRYAFGNWTFCKRKEWNSKWSEFDSILESELEEIFKGNDEKVYESVHASYLDFTKAAALYWQQRAKINWIKEGDAYMFSNIRFCLTNDQKDCLSKPYTRKEVRRAVFQLGPMKSPGPDGIPALFYQRYWYHIKDDVTAAVLSMLKSGNILRRFNHTSIALIPKIRNPETVEQFRPISLCNVIIKIVTKCISNRMRPFMPSLVGNFQNGFIPGRSISDNVVISHELFHHITKKTKGKTGILAFKVDMSKAYDRLDWNFIRYTLVRMNFPPSMINLIMVVSQPFPMIFCLMCINTDKSAISFSPNCTLRVTRSCMKVFGVSGKKEMGKYLGLPTDFGATKKEVFAFIIDKVRKRILCWNNLYLSSAGRLTLICSVLSSLSLYSLSSFKMPVSVSAKIDSLLSHFWWSGTNKWNGFHWCSKLFTSATKSSGGLGIRNVGCLNQSLLAKIGWRILQNPESLVGRTLGLKYNISPSTVINSSDGGLRKTSTSWGGRGILWGLTLLCSKVSWEVGFPSLLDVWRDKWIKGHSLAEILHVNDVDLLQKPVISVCQMQNGGGWNPELVRLICGNVAAPYILSIALPDEDIPDNISWTFTRNGQYSVKTGYSIAFQTLWDAKASPTDLQRMEQSTISFCKSRLWALLFRGKWKIFSWKILSNSLPIGDEERKRSLDWSYLCPFCSDRPCLETMSHIFRDCPLSSRIWSASFRVFVVFFGSNLSLQAWVINWLNLLLKIDDSLTTIPLFVSTIWRIWCIRNSHKLSLLEIDISMSMRLIWKEATLVTNAFIAKRAPEVRTAHSHSQDCPESNSDVENIRNYFPFFLVGSAMCSTCVRLKCDASWNLDLKAASGWVVQNGNGVVLRTGSRRCWASSPFQAEAAALLHALTDAVSSGFRHIEANTDCLNLVLRCEA